MTKQHFEDLIGRRVNAEDWSEFIEPAYCIGGLAPEEFADNFLKIYDNKLFQNVVDNCVAHARANTILLDELAKTKQ